MKDVCSGCDNEIDTEICHCGLSIDEHTIGDGHTPVPIGCVCGYISNEELEKFLKDMEENNGY